MAFSSTTQQAYLSAGQAADEEYRKDAEPRPNTMNCPLRNQTGDVAVRNFTRIIAQFSSELRAAFEAEQAARRAELELYLAIGNE